MKLIQFVARLACLSICAFPCLGASIQKSTVSQREDSSVILSVSQAKAEGDRFVWNFDLQQPGIYVAQLVVETEKGRGDPSGVVEIDGRNLGGALTKAYVIEDGVVSNFEETIDLARAERTRLSCNRRWQLPRCASFRRVM